MGVGVTSKSRSSRYGPAEDMTPMERCKITAKIRDSRCCAIEWCRRKSNDSRAKSASHYTEQPPVQGSTGGLEGHSNWASNALQGCTDRHEKRSAATNEWGKRIRRYECETEAWADRTRTQLQTKINLFLEQGNAVIQFKTIHALQARWDSLIKKISYDRRKGKARTVTETSLMNEETSDRTSHREPVSTNQIIATAQMFELSTVESIILSNVNYFFIILEIKK